MSGEEVGSPPVSGAGWLGLRALFALLVYLAFPGELGEGSALPEAALAGARIALLAVLLLYVSGRWLWLSLPLLAALTVAGAVAIASAGGSLHDFRVIPLLATVQLVAFWLSRRGGMNPDSDKDGLRPKILNWSQRAVAASLTASAILFLVGGGWGWVRSTDHLPLFGERDRLMAAYAHASTSTEAERLPGLGERWHRELPRLERVLDETFRWRHPVTGYGRLLAEGKTWLDGVAGLRAASRDWPDACRAVFVLGLLLELVAGIALLGRRRALAFALAYLPITFLQMTLGGPSGLWHWGAVAIFFLGPARAIDPARGDRKTGSSAPERLD